MARPPVQYNRTRMRLASILLLAATLHADPLAARIRRIIHSVPEARNAFWGIHVVDAATGRVVYTRNADQLFVPASNTKLFSTAVALMRLGADHRFTTRVTADRDPGAEGRVGEIRLVGGGDPNLSARVIPYKDDAFGDDALAAIDELAAEVVKRGVRQVDGDVVGDDTAYEWEPYPDGWAIDDAVWEYGAGVSALAVNDSAFRLWIDPGPAPRSPAALTLWPPFEHLVIHNRTETTAGGEKKLRIDRLPGSSEVTVSGTMPLGQKTHKSLLAAADPALFAAAAFRDALLRRGVAVSGVARALHRAGGEPPPDPLPVSLAERTSAPLSEAIKIINKESQNLHAEMVLREVARRADGSGSRKAGVEALGEFLREIGVEDEQYNFEDGSGLSRLTLVTPRTTVKLLLFLHGTPHRDVWMESLPIAGVDGTLRLRFESVARPSIRAKTGSISHVSSLAGYADRRDGRRYAFAIVANNYNSVHKPVREAIDKIALAVAGVPDVRNRKRPVPRPGKAAAAGRLTR